MVEQENSLVVPLNIERDVGLARDEAKAVATAMGFEALAISEIALGVSEICQNAIRHAGGGKAIITTLNGDKILKIIISDKGKGISNLDQAMQEGFSTIPTSLGIGMDVARKTMDKFNVVSATEKGTTVTLEKHLSIPSGYLEYGVVSVPDERYQHNGDEFLIREFEGDKSLLAVIDGLGQGYEAHVMAVGVKKILAENFDSTLVSLIERCHSFLKATQSEGGVAMSIAKIAPNQLVYLGIGDTHAYLYQDAIFKPIFSIDGRVGEGQLKTLKEQTFTIYPNDIVVLCTDGINTQITLSNADLKFTSQNMANTLFNRYHRLYGDVTILLAKYQPTC